MRKGSEVIGVRLFEHKSHNYHVTDRNGRMYLCGCMPSIRVNGKRYHCFSKRSKRDRITMWSSKSINLWAFNHPEKMK